MTGIVDRIEGEILVIEIDGDNFDIEMSLVDGDVKEGDVVTLIIENGQIVSIVKNEERTQSREEYIEELTKDMWD